MDKPSSYIPMDRRQALAQGRTLPERVMGAALFADISGFTALTEALARALGPQRGAEELTRRLDEVYEALIAEVHGYGGSVVGYSGDAVTCWFDDSQGPGAARATACALAMQAAMLGFAAVPVPGSESVHLAMKAAIVAGPARRFVVGDPAHGLVDVLAGATLVRLAEVEHAAEPGQVVLDAATAAGLGANEVSIQTHETASAGASAPMEPSGVVVVRGLSLPPERVPWPALDTGLLPPDVVRSWLPSAVYARLLAGQDEFLAELRPAVPLFLRFAGLDYDGDPAAPARLDAFIRFVQRVLARYEATLIQLTIGDKGSYLYAVFGAPLAHDDDAARAVGAALELRAPPGDAGGVSDIQIGITTGRLRVGAYGGSGARTYGVLGDATNLAARLMQAAEPGRILAGEAVREAADGFAWVGPQLLRVKGKSDVVAVFSPEQSVAEGRVARLRAGSYELPLVGRSAELAQARALLTRVLQGHGQVLGISGAAGVGKSRLVDELVRTARSRGLLGYGGTAPSYDAGAPYLAWRPIWQGLFNLDGSAGLAEQEASLSSTLVGLNSALVERLPLLGPLLGLALPDTPLTARLDGALRKASLESLVVDALRARARRRPLLLLLEDCQWLDPLGADLLAAVARAIGDLPIWLVLVYRSPEGEGLRNVPADLPYFTEIEMGEIDAAAVAELVGYHLAQGSPADSGPVATAEDHGLVDWLAVKAGGRALKGARVVSAAAPPELIGWLTTRSGGNPFYIEELLHYLRDQGIDPRDTAALEGLQLPNSVHSLILSRIDRLPERRQITIKVASVIGRVFPLPWLDGFAAQIGDAAQVREDLAQLRRLDVLPLDTGEGIPTYQFKHSVTREVAYESLTYATRARLHEQLAHFLEDGGPERAAVPVDLLAYHYGLSENMDKRREYYRKAAEAAAAIYANGAAIGHYRHLAPLLAPTERPPVLLDLGEVEERVGDWAAAEEHYRAALTVAQTCGDGPDVARSYRALGSLFHRRGDYEIALDFLHKAEAAFAAAGDDAGVGAVMVDRAELDRAQGAYEQAAALLAQVLRRWEELGHPQGLAGALETMGMVYHNQGDFPAARPLLERGLALWRELGSKPDVARAAGRLGMVAYHQGDLVAAQALHAESRKLLEEIGDKQRLATALNNLGMVARATGDRDGARTLYEADLALRRELGDRRGLAAGLRGLATLLVADGDAEAGEGLYSEALDLGRSMGDRRGEAYALAGLGRVAAAKGVSEQAGARFGQALDLFRASGDRWGQATALYNLGLLNLETGATADAAAYLGESLALAAALASKHAAACCLAGLGGVAAREGRPVHAAQLLGAADALLVQAGATLDPHEQLLYDQAQALAGLSDEDFVAQRAVGAALPWEDALALAG